MTTITNMTGMTPMARPAVDWLEVISAPEDKRKQMQATVHAVETGGQTCHAIMLDTQWVAGQGKPMMFHSAKAADRFLDMVGVAGSTGEPESIDINCRKARHCFQLTRLGGLSPCACKTAAPEGYALQEDAARQAA